MKRLFMVIGILVICSAVYAQKKHALVIGNRDYKGISPLKNSVNDANDMQASLQKLGFTVDKVLNGNLDQMEAAVTNLKNRLISDKNSYGFFFYAGHGVQANGENYLIPVEANNIQSFAHLRSRAVGLEFIMESLMEAGNTLNMIVLDACRDNPFGWNRGGSRGLSPASHAPSGSIIMYATSANSTADDGTGSNGIFTSQLLKNLETSGLSVFEVFDKTMGDVISVTKGKQHPELSLKFSGASSAYLGSRPSAGTQPAPSPQPSSQAVGSISLTSAIAGEILIDGNPTGIMIKANGNEIINNVKIGDTEVAVKEGNGTIIKARGIDSNYNVKVMLGQTVYTEINIPGSIIGNFSQRGKATQEMKDNGLCAYHPTIPIYYIVSVENTSNGKMIDVRVVNRIPPSQRRIIDLSSDAWNALDLTPDDIVVLSRGR